MLVGYLVDKTYRNAAGAENSAGFVVDDASQIDRLQSFDHSQHLRFDLAGPELCVLPCWPKSLALRVAQAEYGFTVCFGAWCSCQPEASSESCGHFGQCLLPVKLLLSKSGIRQPERGTMITSVRRPARADASVMSLLHLICVEDLSP